MVEILTHIVLIQIFLGSGQHMHKPFDVYKSLESETDGKSEHIYFRLGLNSDTPP